MDFFKIIPTIEQLKISLPSEGQDKKFTSVLRTFNGLTSVDLLNDLAGSLNSKSFQIISDEVVQSTIGEEIFNSFENLSDAINATSDFDLPIDASLALLRARFESQREDLESILKDFVKLSHASLNGYGFEEIFQSHFKKYGYSRIALKKLLLAIFGSKNTKKEEREVLEQILRNQNVSKNAREIFFLAESINPRGRPFSTWYSVDEPIHFTVDHFRRSPIFTEGVCPTPIYEQHVQAYLNGLLASSLPDQAAGLKALIEITQYRGWKTHKSIRKILGEELYCILVSHLSQLDGRKLFRNILGENYSSFTVHTASLALTDFREALLLRNETDRLTLPRLVKFKQSRKTKNPKPISASSAKSIIENLSEKEVKDFNFHFGLCNEERMELPHLLRFLKFRESLPFAKDVDGDAIALLISTGVPTKCYIDSIEVESFALQSEYVQDNLGAMLWSSVLLNGRFSDDADYSFLRRLEKFVISEHAGNIAHAFSALGERHPAATINLVNALYPRRLQKCYMLMPSYQEVNATHRSLLEIAAKITDNVDLIIQADQILLDEKLASARAHIDSSRIYVDESLFHSWFTENIWPSLENIRKQVFLILPGERENLSTAEISALLKGGTDLLSKISSMLQEVYLNDQLVIAYDTFCKDHYFGVDSFLGRRIRHNATHGILLGQLDELCSRIVAQNQHDEWEIRSCYQEWKSSYSSEIDDLVNNRFRFKSADHPTGLLGAEMDTNSERFQSMATDVIAQVITRSPTETILRALTSGCWGLLDPDLKKLRTYLRGEFSRITMVSLDEAFQNSSLPCRDLQTELKATLLEKIERLSSWFSPFNPSETSLSLHDLSQLVWTERESSSSNISLSISGNAREAIVIGGQSRILYDCLHVLLINAAKHGIESKTVSLSLNSDQSSRSVIRDLYVSVSSNLSNSSQDTEASRQKIAKMKYVLFEEQLNKRSLIAHGYSGLRKLRYLLYRMDRENTINLDWNDNIVTIGFSIPIDFVKSDSHA